MAALRRLSGAAASSPVGRDSSSDSDDDRLRSEATLVVVAGGLSQRMGTEKAFAKFRGRPMIESVIGAFERFPHKMVIANNTDGHSGWAALQLPIFADIVRGIGPLGGVHSGLMHLRTPFGFFVSCDVPLVQWRVMRRMWAQHIAHGSTSAAPTDAVVAVDAAEKIHPLFAFYSRRCLPAMAAQIDSGGGSSMRAFLQRIRASTAFARLTPEESATLRNINYPQELE